MNKLSVVIPAYNEEKRIVKTLEDVGNFLAKQNYEYEILAVNDGSRDNTAGVIKSYEGKIQNLRLIDNKENHGKGWAVKQGMLEATGDVRVFMDADNSTKIDEIINFLPFFDQGFDVVVGSRRIKGSNIVAKQSPLRDFLGGVFRFIVHTLVPVGVTDSQCGFKAFSAKATEAVFPNQTIYRWAFDVEILALTNKLGFKVKEAPIRWVDDASSHVKLSGMINMLLEVLQVRINLWTGKY
jgi:dolichyl-phosphate beta-glucosyltransferase